jgi:predicted nucleic acid-binding protein
MSPAGSPRPQPMSILSTRLQFRPLPHELIVGARSQRDAAGIDSLIQTYPVRAELGAQITSLAYELLKRYAKSDGLRTFDALIAATAIEETFTLVSKNRKHFQMISELNLEVPNY